MTRVTEVEDKKIMLAMCARYNLWKVSPADQSEGGW